MEERLLKGKKKNLSCRERGAVTQYSDWRAVTNNNAHCETAKRVDFK